MRGIKCDIYYVRRNKSIHRRSYLVHTLRQLPYNGYVSSTANICIGNIQQEKFSVTGNVWGNFFTAEFK